MTEQAPEPKKPSSCGRIIGFIFKTLFVIILGVVLGVAIYYGATVLYQNYVTSVQNNTRQIGGLDVRLQQAEDLIKDQFTDLEVRLKTLERTGSNSQSDLQTLQTQSAGLMAAQKAQTTAQAALEGLQTQSAAAATQAAESLSRLAALETALPAQQAQNAQLLLELKTLQAAQLLARARSELLSSNLGLAQQDIQAAEDLLAALPTESAPPEVAAAQTYLTTALENLPLKPVAAADAVDSAWSLLVTGGLVTPPVAAEPLGTPVPAVTTTLSAPATSQGGAHTSVIANPASTEAPIMTEAPAPTEPPTEPPTPPPYPAP